VSFSTTTWITQLERFPLKTVYATFVLLTGLALLPRLGLRLSLLYLPFLLGVRLEERGEIERRGLEGDLEIGFWSMEASEYGERERPLPRDGDREGITVVLLRRVFFFGKREEISTSSIILSELCKRSLARWQGLINWR